MDSLLYKLYSGEYDFNPERDERQRQLYQKRYEEWDKVQRVFGDEFIDRVFRLEGGAGRPARLSKLPGGLLPGDPAHAGGPHTGH